ncbi:DUF3419 family protein [Desulfosoma caldarium]|uniref:Uncharacterized protein DUF3419 n=1 Tax=Desulfosoma caldarium TaxID=610254 RepID=A0A3N1VLE4_9BACT|nr:DUF3419 family protein [Desulfosoma caldarium]ROR01838.1 uncharacterized protein DUF3419 [Desulfosoma caldarium]
MKAKPFEEKAFHEASTPYLVPTEHPWAAPAPLPVQGLRILCVAGSGDIPIYFLSCGAGSLVAVDVSVGACAMAELKRAAYRGLDRQAFCRFFFEGIGEAKDLWMTARDPKHPAFSSRSAVYALLRDDLGPEARRFFDPIMAAHGGETNPFEAFLRPTDRVHLGLLPFLLCDDAYGAWAEGARRHFPIVCSLLEDFLAGTGDSFHVIYTSNVVEYVRSFLGMHFGLGAFRKAMESLWKDMHRVLFPKGFAVFYVHQGLGTETFRRTLKELAPPPSLGYKTHLVPINLRAPTLPSAVWRHVLVLFQKPPAPREMAVTVG